MIVKIYRMHCNKLIDTTDTDIPSDIHSLNPRRHSRECLFKMRKRRKMTTKQCPFKTEIERVYRVCGFAYQNNRPQFLRNFTESMIKVYGECPTPLSFDTLKQFLQTSEPEDDQEVFKMIHVWKSLLQLHYPDHYKRFDEICEAFVKKDRLDEEAEAREARARARRL